MVISTRWIHHIYTHPQYSEHPASIPLPRCSLKTLAAPGSPRPEALLPITSTDWERVCVLLLLPPLPPLYWRRDLVFPQSQGKCLFLPMWCEQHQWAAMTDTRCIVGKLIAASRSKAVWLFFFFLLPADWAVDKNDQWKLCKLSLTDVLKYTDRATSVQTSFLNVYLYIFVEVNFYLCDKNVQFSYNDKLTRWDAMS